MSRDREALQASALCAGLTAEELEGLRGAAEVRTYAAGERIVAEDTPSDCLFILETGSVRVEKGSASGAPVVLAAFQEPGDFFGEMSLIDILPRSADVRAQEAVRLLAFPKRKLAEFFSRFPRVQMTLVLNIARSLSLRLRDADERIVELSRVLKTGARTHGA